jgi:centractin
LVKRIKEKRCSVSPSAQADDKFLEEKKIKEAYILPDGNTLELSFEKNRAPEILFSPEKIGLECNCIYIKLIL